MGKIDNEKDTTPADAEAEQSESSEQATQWARDQILRKRIEEKFKKGRTPRSIQPSRNPSGTRKV